MWFFFVRGPRPDLHVWPGRRWVSAADALAWPIAAMVAVIGLADAGGRSSSLIVATLCVLAVRRLLRAILVNQRYRMTTVWLAKIAVVPLLFGVLTKLAQALTV
jgi:hypothetical protein